MGVHWLLLSFILLLLNRELLPSSCQGSSNLLGRFFREILLLSPRSWGDTLPGMSFLGHSTPWYPSCTPLENIYISLHVHLLKMRPSSKGLWSHTFLPFSSEAVTVADAMANHTWRRIPSSACRTRQPPEQGNPIK